MDYAAFLESKRLNAPPCGFDVALAALNPALFDWQAAIVQWALRRGRAALFEDCGCGKGPQAMEWARQVHLHTGQNILISAPLAVSQQFVREGQKFGIAVHPCRTQSDVVPGLNVTNYEMLGHFDPQAFAGIVTDESSILKSFEGKVRRQITDFARAIPFRLACTATPAPNDLEELTNHAEFLEILSGREMLALFFTQDGNTTHRWRLKGHAREAFWSWMASWAIALRKPSDLGYSDDGFTLPPLQMRQVTVEAPAPEGMLFSVEALDLATQRAARKASIEERVEACAELVNGNREPWLVWCDLNAESEALAAAIPDAVEVKGSDSREWKEQAMLDFQSGKIRVLVSKPSLCGHGMNYQHCAHVAFVGVSHSYELWYQAIRRCWRYGQTRPVQCYMIASDADGPILRNLERKEQQADEMMSQIVKHMAGLSLGHATRDEAAYGAAKAMQLPSWIGEKVGAA